MNWQINNYLCIKTRKNILKNIFIAALFMLLLPTTVYAAPEYINFQASIRKPDGTRLEAPDVSFRLKYLNAAASCTVYVEDFQNHSMVGSGGSVSLLMGSGVKVFPVTATSLFSTFNNATSNSMACAEGGTYSPTLSTERRLVTVEFYYSGSNGLQIISNIEVNAVPYAMHASNAEQLAGFAANLYTKFSDFTTCTGGDVLTYNGTAFSCVPAGGTSQWSSNAANIYFNTGNVGIGTNTPGAALDVRGVISNGASDFIIGSHDGRSQGVNPNQRALVHHDSTAGYFDDALILNYAGDFEGGTYLEGPRVVLPTGNLGVGVANPLHKIDVNGDINVTGNFKVNGVNIATGGGTVTSVTASPPLLSSGGNTPDISMPAATAAVDGYLSAADFTTFNNKVSSQWVNNLTDIFFNTGNVGIGTNSPAAKLDIRAGGPSDQFYLSDTNTRTTFNSTGSAGVIYDISPIPASGTDLSAVRYFRNTNTTGSKLVQFLAGNGTSSVESQIGHGTGINTFFNASGVGNVGIGLNNPAYKLDVAGDINVTGNFKINGTNISNTPSPWLMNAADTYFNTGNVGIGTNTPPYPLSVKGTGGSNPSLGITESSAGQPIWLRVDQSASASAFELGIAGAAGQFLTDVPAGAAVMKNYGTGAVGMGFGGGSSPLATLYLKWNGSNAGNVGIGTTSPTAKLDVVGNGQFSNGLYVNGAAVNSGATSLILNNQNAADETYALSVGLPNSSETGFGINKLTGYTVGAGIQSISTNLFRILPNGNTGVGVGTPAYKLDVAGDVNVTGNFKVNGVNIGSGSVGGSGTVGAIPKFSASNTLADSNISDNGTSVAINANTSLGGTFTPQAKLSIGGPLFSSRPWMDNGVTYGIAGETDGGYIGLKNEGPNHVDMVVAWGDDGNEALRFIGLPDGGPVNGVEHMRIEGGSGNVGIGTSTPAFKLDVSGETAFRTNTNARTITSFSTSTDNAIQWDSTGYRPAGSKFSLGLDLNGAVGFSLYNDTTSTHNLFVSETGNIGVGTIAPAHKLDVDGDVNVTGTFKVNGVNISNTPSPWLMNVADTYFNTGKVGVGTNAPLNKLHVYSTTSADGLSIDGTTDPGITLRTSGTVRGYAPVVVTNNASYFADALAGDMAFRSEANNILFGQGSSNSTMAIVGNKVGIGTTTPGSPLSVMIKHGNPNGLSFLKNDVPVGQAFFNFANATSAPGVLIPMFHTKSNHTGTEYANAFIADTNTDGVGQGTVTSFMARTSNTTVVNRDLFDFSNWAPTEAGGATAMRIKANGNIGVGTVTPAYKLDVAGDVNVTGNFKINGANITSSQWTTTGADIYNSNAGNVGIGTAGAPLFKLDVNGSVRSTEYTFAVTPGDPAPTMTARLVPAGQGASLEKSELILFHSNDGYNSSGPDQIALRAPALSFQTYADATVNDISNNNGYNERMYITPNGEVGINTTTPRAKFEINGTVVMKAAVDNPTASINFDAGNLQYTALDCQAFALNNLKDGGSYMFVVQGTNAATCSFTAFSDNGVTPLIVKLPPDHGATTNGKETIYNIVVMGSKVYFSWTPGY